MFAVERVAVDGVAPLSVMVCVVALPGAPPASSAIVAVALRTPAAVGLKVKLMVQLADTATAAPFVHVVPVAMAKSPAFAPEMATPVAPRVKVAVPEFVTVAD